MKVLFVDKDAMSLFPAFKFDNQCPFCPNGEMFRDHQVSLHD